MFGSCEKRLSKLLNHDRPMGAADTAKSTIANASVTYQSLYPRQWKSPIFNHPLAFWDESHGLPIDTHPAGKIVVFGFPKSGNVWVQSLLMDSLGLPPIEPLLDVDRTGIGMTHRPFDAHVGDRADFIHGVCIIRDLRDVVASYFRYSQTPSFRAARPEFHYDNPSSFYFDWFLSRAAPAHRLPTHSEEYANLGVPVVRYERLRTDAVSELRRLFACWGLCVNDGAIVRSVEANSIERLSQFGKTLEREVPCDHFFGGGVVGGYLAVLPQIVIEDIESRFGRVLRRWGYPLSDRRGQGPCLDPPDGTGAHAVNSERGVEPEADRGRLGRESLC